LSLLCFQMVKSIGGIFIDDLAVAHTATHVIASDGKKAVRRTVKLMIAHCRTAHIVSLDWLIASASEGKALECTDFLIMNNDKLRKEAEKRYVFSFLKSMNNRTRRLKDGVHLLDGWSVYVCRGVAGNNAPSEEEFRLLVEAAGASWLTDPCASFGERLDDSSATTSTQRRLLLIVTSDPERTCQVWPDDVDIAVRNGAAKRKTTWLFNAFMAQDIGRLAYSRLRQYQA
jgi:hypothetical protein